MAIDTQTAALTAKDFATDQEVRWCPGCGDYSILAQVQKVMPTLRIPRKILLWFQVLAVTAGSHIT
jgi:2-oxoglutarate ferredoxin oxidoreductase subunit beta